MSLGGVQQQPSSLVTGGDQQPATPQFKDRKLAEFRAAIGQVITDKQRQDLLVEKFETQLKDPKITTVGQANQLYNQALTEARQPTGPTPPQAQPQPPTTPGDQVTVTADANQPRPYSPASFQQSLNNLEISQRSGTGAFHIYGPLNPQQMEEAKQLAAQKGMNVVTSQPGGNHLVVYNQAQGTPSEFTAERTVNPMFEYHANIPPLPEIKNDGFFHQLGSVDFAEIALSILAGVEKKDHEFNNKAFTAMFQGDVSLPAEKEGRKVDMTMGGGESSKVQIKWNPPGPVVEGPTSEEPAGPAEEPGPTPEEPGPTPEVPPPTSQVLTSTSESESTVLGQTLEGQDLDQMTTQGTGTTYSSTVGRTDSSAVDGKNYRTAFTDPFYFQIGYQEVAYLDVLLEGKDPSPQDVRNEIRGEGYNRAAGSTNSHLPGAVNNGKAAGGEDRKFIKEEFLRLHPEKAGLLNTNPHQFQQEVNQFVQEQFVGPAREKYESTHRPGSFDELNPAQRAALIRDEIQTAQIAAGVFEQAKAGWENANPDQRQQMFPGLPQEAYTKSWGELSPDAQKQVVRKGVLGDPSTDPPTPPCIRLSVVATTDPSHGVMRNGEWSWTNAESRDLANQRAAAATTDIINALASKGVISNTSEERQKVKASITTQTNPHIIQEGQSSGSLNLQQEGALVTTQVVIPETTTAEKSNLSTDPGAGNITLTHTVGDQTSTYSYNRSAKSITVESGGQTTVYDFANKQVIVTAPNPQPPRPMTDDEARQVFNTMQGLVERFHGGKEDTQADDVALSLLSNFKNEVQERMQLNLDDPELGQIQEGVQRLLATPEYQDLQNLIVQPMQIHTENGRVLIDRISPPGGVIAIPKEEVLQGS